MPRGLLTASLLIVLIWGISAARPFLVPLCIAALLAFLMEPLVRFLRRSRLPEWLSIVCAALLLVLPLPGIVFAMVKQVQSLIHDFPTIFASVNRELIRISQSGLGQRLQLSRYLDPTALGEKLASRFGQGLSLILSGLGMIVGTGSHLALVLLFAIMMLASRVHLRKSCEKILARFESIEGAAMLGEVTSLIERFLIARFLIVLVIGVSDWAILKVFGVKYDVLLGALLGVMTLIPAIGFIIGLVPSLLVSFAAGNSFLSTFFMALCLVGMSIVESYVLTPKMVGNRLNINALFTFVGLFAGGLLWGVAGMFLSIPIMGILRIAFYASPTLQPWGELLAERDDGLADTVVKPRKEKNKAA